MTLKFNKLSESKEGIIYTLLNRSYEGLTRQIPELLNKWQDDWRQYDEEVHKFPDTIGNAGFLTSINEKEIGFGSYDPRQSPELGIIGHNCILPEFRGNNFGKAQILKITKSKFPFRRKYSCTVRIAVYSLKKYFLEEYHGNN